LLGIERRTLKGRREASERVGLIERMHRAGQG
jgi:hypothetical protein